MSFFSHVETGASDPILGLNTAFKEDPSPNKVNLGVGAYRTDEGKPLVLSAVKKAERIILESPKFDKEYLGIEGLVEFNKACASIIFGQELAQSFGGRLVSAQSISGTGAVRIGFEFIKTFLPQSAVYLPEPTWPNHKAMLQAAGVAVKEYRYYDRATNTLNFSGMCEDLKNAPEKSVILLHACAHNPTGLDPSLEQWNQLADLIKQRNLVPFFDCAYQGFASGNLDKDASAIRLFAQKGLEMFLCQSFAKNMGLYGERAGCFHLLCADSGIAAAVSSQVKRIIRPMYSSPPKHGAEVVFTILSQPELKHDWETELKAMADRIGTMRIQLYEALIQRKTPGEWGHMLTQIGMFSYTGLKVEQVNSLIKDHHIYLTSDGRISIAGLNSKNLNYVADSIHAVCQASKL